MESLALIMFIGFGALVFFLAYWMQQQNRQKWQNFAQQYNLAFAPGNFFQRPAVNGQYRGVEINLRSEVRGGGKHKHTYTVLDAIIKHPSNLQGLKIYKEGFLSKFGKAIGTQDIEIGDPQFDQAVMIKCDEDEKAVRAYLNDPLRRAILALVSEYPSAHFGQSGCHMEQRGFIGNIAKLEHIFDLMVACCKQGSINTNSDDDDHNN